MQLARTSSSAEEKDTEYLLRGQRGVRRPKIATSQRRFQGLSFRNFKLVWHRTGVEMVHESNPYSSINPDSPDYFSLVYKTKDETGQLGQTKIDQLRDKLLVRLFNRYGEVSLSHATVIDVGCGYGWLLQHFQGAAHIYGTDISTHAVQVTASRLPQCQVKVADLQKDLPVEKACDLVLAVNVIEHLSDPKAAVQSIVKVIKPGGLAIVHLPTVNNWISKYIYSKSYDLDPTHIYRPTGKQVNELFEDFGFTTLRQSYLPHFPGWLTRWLPIHPSYLAVFRYQN